MDYPEEFTPIAAGLKRLPYFSPSADFSDRVIAGVTRLHAPGAQAPPEVRPPQLEVIRGAVPRYAPGVAVTAARRRRAIKIAVAVPASIGIFVAVSVLFAQLDMVAILLSTAGAELGTLASVMAVSAGSLVLGDAAMATIEAGAAQATLLYLVIAVGLLAGYGGIKTAAAIARRKAA